MGKNKNIIKNNNEKPFIHCFPRDCWIKR